MRLSQPVFLLRKNPTVWNLNQDIYAGFLTLFRHISAHLRNSKKNQGMIPTRKTTKSWYLTSLTWRFMQASHLCIIVLSFLHLGCDQSYMTASAHLKKPGDATAPKKTDQQYVDLMCNIFIMSVYHTFSIIILFRFRQGLGNTLSLVPIGNRTR